MNDQFSMVSSYLILPKDALESMNIGFFLKRIGGLCNRGVLFIVMFIAL